MALASSLVYAASAGVGALAGSLAPLVAGIGTVALAFYDMDKAQKEALKVKVRPLTDAFKDLADVAREGVFSNIGEQARGARDALTAWRPVIRDIGDAVSDVADNWLEMTTGDGYTAFVESMGSFLPNAVRDLGDSFGNAIGGMGGLLRGMIPITQTFLGWLSGITATFNEWANSDLGQAEITRFFADAADSMRDVSFFLGSVRDLFNELVSAGREAGDSLFRSMGEAIQGWVSTLRKNPDILTDWYDAAVDFGEAIGAVVVAVGKLFDALDNDTSRALAVDAFELLASALEAIHSVVGPVAAAFNRIDPNLQSAAIQAAGAAFAFSRLNRAVSAVSGGMAGGGLIANMRNTQGRLGALKGAARGAAGPAGLMMLVGASQETNDAVSLMGSTLGGALTGLSVGGPWGALIGGAGGLLLGLIGKMEDTGASAQQQKRPILDYADTFDTLTGKITEATRAMALQKLQRSDIHHQARQFGISTRDLVSAMVGEQDAINRVNRALNGQKDLLGGLTADNVRDRLSKFIGEFDREARAAREAASATTSWRRALDGLPKEVRTEVKQIGMDMSLRELADLQRRYNLTPKQVRTIIKATDLNLTKREVNELLEGLRKTGKMKVTPKADLDAKAAERARRKMDNWLDILDGTKVDPKAGLDTSRFDKDHKGAMGDLKDFDRQRPTPKGLFDGSRFNAVYKNLWNDLTDLDRRKVTPKADADTSDATRKVSGVRGDLQDLNTMSVSPTVSIIDRASGVIDNIASGLAGLASRVLNINANKSAAGRITSGPMLSWFGEEGPEAVVPLNRPLSQVDPSVRWLSAIAQGKGIPKMAGGGIAGGGRTVNVEMNVYSPQSDPRAVAVEAINHLVAVGY
jgi:hypothetical protein